MNGFAYQNSFEVLQIDDDVECNRLQNNGQVLPYSELSQATTQV